MEERGSEEQDKEEEEQEEEDEESGRGSTVPRGMPHQLLRWAAVVGTQDKIHVVCSAAIR